jgi:peptide alpha-N-acetyltransferase
VGEDDHDEQQLTSKTLQDAIQNNKVLTGYIGMLAVEKPYRRSGIGTALVHHAIHRMKEMGCTSIRLETEVSNKSAMRLYEERFGFMREELLVKYYLNWGDAYRLRLWLD